MYKLFWPVFFSLSTAICCILPFKADAQYEISGRLNNYDSLWLNEISLSAINSTTQLYYASADIIINKDSLDKKGNFTMKGNNLPDENRIYRLGLVDLKNAIELTNYNHIFLILNNHSSVKIHCNNFSRSPFNYQIEGSAQNTALQKFEIYLDGIRKMLSNPNSQTGTGKEYAINRFNNDIRQYCDTCKYSIVALIALNGVDNFEKDYAAHPDFYKQFLRKIQSLPDSNSIYVKEFEKKLNSLDNPDQPGSSKAGNATNVLVYVEGIVILFLLGFIWYLKNKIKPADAVKNEPDRAALFETLTRREKEILALLIEDIQNKEIANKLNLEVSTIKTHVGKIYQKLAISNRNEVKAFAQYLKNNGA